MMPFMLLCLTVVGIFTRPTISTALIEQRSTLTKTAPVNGTAPCRILNTSSAERNTLPAIPDTFQVVRQAHRKRDSHNRCPFNSPVLEIAVVVDESLCEKFGNASDLVHAYLKNAVRDAQRILNPKTCLTMEIEFFGTHCPSFGAPYLPSGSFSLAKYLRGCSVSNKSCSRSTKILQLLKEDWDNFGRQISEYDMVLLVTGEQDGTDLLGASFANNPCDSRFGFAWMEVKIESTTTNKKSTSLGLNAAVLAHEVGHLLGALHDSKGIMKRNIKVGENYFLSSSSANSINKFVMQDPRAWCLPRASRVNETSRNRWSSFYSIGRRGNVADIAMVKRPMGDQTFAYILSRNGEKIEYSVSKLTICKNGSQCGWDGEVIHYYNIPIRCSTCNYGTIALRQSINSTSVAVVVGHTKRSTENGNRISGHFQMSQPEEPGKQVTPKWLDEVQVPDWAGDNFTHSERASVCGMRGKALGEVVAIGMGDISYSQSTDLVWIYAVQEKGRTVVKYKIGFKLDVNGKVTDGWGGAILVPGWFGSHMDGLRVALHNVGGKDMVDMIVCHGDKSARTCSAYCRVGYDLNSTGHVTGGWTDDVRIRDFEIDLRPLFDGVSVVEFIPGGPSIVVSSRIDSSKIPFHFSQDLLTGLSSGGRKIFRAGRDITSRCYECYSNEVAAKCASTVEVCAAWKDEVRLDGGTLPVSAMKDGAKTFENITTVRLTSSQKWDSISCEGFDYLYIYSSKRENRDGCDLTSSRKVIGYGILLAFKHVLTEYYKGEIKFSEENTNTGNEGGGTNGPRGKGVAATIRVYSNRIGRYEAISKAMLQLKKRYNDYNDFLTASPDVIKHPRGGYKVSFLLKRGLF